MALIKCQECSAEVSDRAGTCVKCGAPLNKPVGLPSGSANDAGMKNMGTSQHAPKKGNVGKIVAICIVCVVAIVVLLAVLGDYIDDEESGSSSAPVATLTAVELMKAYSGNTVAADNLYKRKWIQITGTISSINKDSYGEPYVLFERDFMDTDIWVYFADKSIYGSLKPKQKITFVARCMETQGEGFVSIMMDKAFIPQEKPADTEEGSSNSEANTKSDVSKSDKGTTASASGSTGNTFTDTRDNKKYRSVKIGNKTWMAENLNYKIGNSWCYDNKDSNCQKYGLLYDWNTAMEACPAGWRLTTRDDWNNLVQETGGESAGGMLQATTDWKMVEESVDDESNKYNFSALPGGNRWNGAFNHIGESGFWWTATENGSDRAFYRAMAWDLTRVNENHINKGYGFSVRCVKN